MAFRRLLTSLAVVHAVEAWAAPKAEPWAFWEPRTPTVEKTVDHGDWQRLLDAYLVTEHPSGVYRFRYGDVRPEHRGTLRDYLQELQALDPRSLPGSEQLAYWINLYNALTVDLVLAHYPVESIRKIRPHFFAFGPWDMEVAEVAGQDLTLNDIEHRILRPLFREPRIHFAINCASIGCPNLSARAFTGANAESQLEDLTSAFLAHPRGMEWRSDGLFLSSIFNWFAEDFGGERGVLAFIARYVPAAAAGRLRNHDGSISYGYDWRLNDHP